MVQCFRLTCCRVWSTLSNVRELQSFSGLASYYRRFIKAFATIDSPLHRLTDKSQSFSWGDPCKAAFVQLKEALTKAPVLAYSKAQQPSIEDTDASKLGVGNKLCTGLSREELEQEPTRTARCSSSSTALLASCTCQRYLQFISL